MVRQVSIAELAGRLSPRETVFIGGSAGEPVELSGLLERDDSIAPAVRFITSFVPGINTRNLAGTACGRSMGVFFVSAGQAEARLAGRIRFLPWAYSAIEQHLSSPQSPIDAVIVQVGVPDKHGQCSLGPAVEFMPGLLRRAARVLAVVNPNVPDLPGSPRVAIERCECYADSSAPLAEYSAGEANAASKQIAQHLLPLIPAGCTLQIGLGKVPSQLLRGIAGLRNVAFHTGMLSDSVLEVAAAGALRDALPLTATVAVGSASFYQRLGSLPGLKLAGVEHTHDAAVLARIPRFFAINSALEVDIRGQVNAESLAGRFISGPGGLPDFAHAARRCPDGLSIIVLNSTDAAGRQSRIVSALPAGASVTVPQHDVDAVVTEWGAALLRGCDLDERARRLIAIAHPAHRAGLGIHPVD